MPESTRVILIGTGFVAGEHLKALDALADAEVVGVVDVDPGRGAAFARSAGGIAAHTDLGTALAELTPHAAVICTPNGTHPEIATTLAAVGVHALVEKPLAIDEARAAEMVAAFDRAGLVLAAAHSHRFSEYGNAVKAVASSGQIGQPQHVRVTMLGGWTWTDWRNWQVSRELSGGHSLHNGVHLLDLAAWWIDDEPVEIHAQGRKQSAAELEIHDHLLITVRFAGGQTAVCEMSRANQPRAITYREVYLAGTTGSAHLPWDGETPLLFDDGVTNRLPGSSSFAVQAANWVAAVRGEQPPAVTGADGLMAVRMGVAAEQSLATGRPVRLDPSRANTWPRRQMTSSETNGDHHG